jgi:hypothetical protein
MVTSFSGGRSRREPPTMGKQLVNFITCGCEHVIEIMNTIEVEISLFESILSVTPQDSHCISFGDCVIETFFIRAFILAKTFISFWAEI